MLTVDGLTKRFGSLVANDGVALAARKGDVHAVIGPNGAGKTTLIAQLAGELLPDAGSIRLGDIEITRWPPHRRARAGLARSFQITSIMPTLTVREHVALAAARADLWHPWRRLLDRADIARKVDAILARLGLEPAADRAASTLAHGTRRELEIAMALALEPAVLLLDEPTAGLGAQESAAIAALIRAIARDIAIVLVEHDMDVVFSVADTVSVLVEGRVIACGAPTDVRANPAVRAAYLG